MAVSKRQFIDGPYGQVHYRIAQPKTVRNRPLVCIHMFPQSGRNFERFIEEASLGRVVVAPDFPGYGESDPPPSPISADKYAEAMWTAIEAILADDQHTKIDLFGIHAGAKLAAEMTRQCSDRVNKLVLSSAAVLDDDEIEALQTTYKPVPLDKEGTRFKHLWNIIISNSSEKTPLETKATFFAEMLRGGEGYEWGHMAVFEYNRQFGDVLKSIQHPVALLNPGDDLYEHTPKTQSYIKNCDYFEYPEWEHGFLEHHASDVATLVNGWLE